MNKKIVVLIIVTVFTLVVFSGCTDIPITCGNGIIDIGETCVNCPFDVGVCPPVTADYYVSTSGSDSNSGTLEMPFATLVKAMSVSSSGDIIDIRGGTYTKSITVSKSGLTIRNYNGETVIFKGISSPAVKFSTGVSNIVLKGITFQDTPSGGQGGTCVSINPGNNYITFSYCNFYNLPEHVFYLYNEEGASTGNYCEHLTISHCMISNVGYGSGYMGECITLEGCKNYVFSHNTLKDFTKQGIYNGDGTCYGIIEGNTFINTNYFSFKIDTGWSRTANYCHDIIIRNNSFTGVGTTSKREIAINPEVGYGASNPRIYNIEIINNIFNVKSNTGGFTYPISIWSDAVGTQFNNIRIMYNTIFVDSSYGAITITNQNSATFTNCVFSNNIVVTTKTASQGSTSTSSGWVFKNNCYYYPSGSASGISVVGLGDGGIRANPLFVNIGSDFHLTASSPCKDTASSAYVVSHDYEGNQRPFGSGYDIGAYEYSKELGT